MKAEVYESAILAFLYCQVHKLVSGLSSIKFFQKHIFLFLKSLIVPLFIISLVLLPGFDTTAYTFKRNILSESVANRTMFFLGIIVFLILLTPLFFLAIKEAAKRQGKLIFYRIDIILAIFLIIASFSVINSFNINASFSWLLKFVRSVTVYFIFSRLVFDRKQILYLFYTVIGIVFFEGALTVLQFLRGGILGVPFENVDKLKTTESLIFKINESSAFRAVGTLHQPNVLATLLAILLPLTAVFVINKSLILKILSYAALGLCLVLPIVLLSRWGIITAFFAFFLTVFLLHRYTKRISIIPHIKRFLFLIVLLIVIILLNPAIQNRFLEFSPDDRSFQARTELISEAVYIIQTNPLPGVGGGAFSYYLVNYDFTESGISTQFPAPVHNTYLLIASELGLPGLFVLLLLMAEIIRLFLTAIKNFKTNERIVIILLFSSIATFFFNGLWEPISLTKHIDLFFFVILGIFVNIIHSRMKNFEEKKL